MQELLLTNIQTCIIAILWIRADLFLSWKVVNIVVNLCSEPRGTDLKEQDLAEFNIQDFLEAAWGYTVNDLLVLPHPIPARQTIKGDYFHRIYDLVGVFQVMSPYTTSIGVIQPITPINLIRPWDLPKLKIWGGLPRVIKFIFDNIKIIRWERFYRDLKERLFSYPSNSFR